MSQDDILKDILNKTASQISSLLPNPRTWLPWILYLLERLETEANSENSTYRDLYRDMLAALEDSLRNKRNTGGW